MYTLISTRVPASLLFNCKITQHRETTHILLQTLPLNLPSKHLLKMLICNILEREVTFTKISTQIMSRTLVTAATWAMFWVSYCTQVTLQYLGVPEVHLILLNHLPADHAPVVHHNIQVSPGAEFPLPVCYGGKWSYDQERAPYTSQQDFIQECYGLNGFAKAHFIC